MGYYSDAEPAKILKIQTTPYNGIDCTTVKYCLSSDMGNEYYLHTNSAVYDTLRESYWYNSAELYEDVKRHACAESTFIVTDTANQESYSIFSTDKVTKHLFALSNILENKIIEKFKSESRNIDGSERRFRCTLIRNNNILTDRLAVIIQLVNIVIEEEPVLVFEFDMKDIQSYANTEDNIGILSLENIEFRLYYILSELGYTNADLTNSVIFERINTGICTHFSYIICN